MKYICFVNSCVLLKNNLFIDYVYYLWLHWVFVTAHSFSLVVASGGYSSCVWASRCSGFSCCGAQAPELTSFSRFCGAWAWLSCGMWNLPRAGIESMFPALTGRLLTTGSPVKYPKCTFKVLLTSSF